MRGAVFALVAVAILAAGGAAFFANRMATAPRPLPVAEEGEPVPLAGVLVLVAATDISPGKTIGSGAYRWQPWPDDMVRTEYARSMPLKEDASVRKTIAARFEGRLARRHIAAGEPLTEANVFERQAVGFLAGTLESGKRAMSVAVTPESGAGGFVLPGDRVDVILSHDVTRSLPRQLQDFGSEAGVVKNAAETVLQDVRVLAADQTVAKTADGEAVVAKTATLEVSPYQAQVLALAATMGTLSLSLRSLDADAVRDGSDPVVDMMVSPVLARAISSAERRVAEEAKAKAKAEREKASAGTETRIVGQTKPGKPAWSVSIYRGGVSRVQTVEGK